MFNNSNHLAKIEFFNSTDTYNIEAFQSFRNSFVDSVINMPTNFKNASFFMFNCANVRAALFKGMPSLNGISLHATNLHYAFVCASLNNVSFKGVNDASYLTGSFSRTGASVKSNIGVGGISFDTFPNLYCAFISISNLNVPIVLPDTVVDDTYHKSLERAFFNTNVPSIDIAGKFNISRDAFNMCNKLVTAKVNFINCINAVNMFAGCSSLETIDFTGINLSVLPNLGIENMFRGCVNLRYTVDELSSIFDRNFRNSAVQKYCNTFYGCTSIIDLENLHPTWWGI
jgi:hypothetical protein